MASIETPPKPTSDNSGGSSASAPKYLHSDMEEEDLHLLIAEMRDENSRSRLREALWISIIFHMVVLFTIRQAQFLFPHHSVTLQSPEQMLKERDLTFLELPP